MIILHKEYKYLKRDKCEGILLKLANTINALPGIKLSIVSFEKNINIFFYVEKSTDVGLFFLTRCCDGRYWKYGYKWKLELSVGDTYRNKQLPICYLLYSLDNDNIIEQVDSLVKNMNHHLHQENFMKSFELNFDDFSTVDELALQRDKQLDKIL